MKLHQAIEKLVQQNSEVMTTQQIADKLNKNSWYEKKDGSDITAFQIYGRTKKYSDIFRLDGSKVFLLEQAIFLKSKSIITSLKKKTTNKILANKDEVYVLNICDNILGLNSSRQHKFDFLLGDPNSKGIKSKLPVDSYYEELKLVIEYYEQQHTEIVLLFDKSNKITISGVHRGEQRKIYDDRRRQILPKNNILLIEISYSDFNYTKQKRIIRDEIFDKNVIKEKLKNILEKKLL